MDTHGWNQHCDESLSCALVCKLQPGVFLRKMFNLSQLEQEQNPHALKWQECLSIPMLENILYMCSIRLTATRLTADFFLATARTPR